MEAQQATNQGLPPKSKPSVVSAPLQSQTRTFSSFSLIRPGPFFRFPVLDGSPHRQNATPSVGVSPSRVPSSASSEAGRPMSSRARVSASAVPSAHAPISAPSPSVAHSGGTLTRAAPNQILSPPSPSFVSASQSSTTSPLRLYSGHYFHSPMLPTHSGTIFERT